MVDETTPLANLEASRPLEVVLSPEALDALTMVANDGHWITPVAVVVSALLTGFIGYIVNRRMAEKNHEGSRQIQAQKATLDFIAEREIDADILKAKTAFNQQRDHPNGFDNFLQNCSNHELQESVKTIMNDYELTALGIKQGILDQAFYREWFEGSFLKDYQAVRPLIKDIREKENRHKIYNQFENLAVKWGAPEI